MKAALGHDGPPKGSTYWRENLADGRPLQICPRRLLLLAEERDPELYAQFRRHVDEYYEPYRQGHLLISGGVASQPAIYLDYMRTVGLYRKLVQLKADSISKQPLDGEE